MHKKALRYSLILLGIPLVIAIGVVLFRDRKYQIISLVLALAACVPFFLSFEKRGPNAKELVLLAVMVALSVAGRAGFAPLPRLKPVTALVGITAIYFGPEAGFLTGALSAVVSNFLFGQGPWTPFQMFVWGFLGFLAGLLARRGWLESRVTLSLYGVFAGAAFSLMMDVWTVLAFDGVFSLARYLAAAAASLPFLLTYAVSNVVFLLLLERPIGRKLERVKVKYGLMEG